MDIPTPSTAASDLDRYGIEVLCANWIPAVAVLADPVARVHELLTNAANTDVEAFLARFYLSQHG